MVGVPKTIDNDIPFIDQSFGFQTAFAYASDAIRAAAGGGQVHGQRDRAGQADGPALRLHRLLRRAGPQGADAVLIPEVPFALDGDGGLLAYLRSRVAERGSAVVVVAEGAGQDLLGGRDERRAGRLRQRPAAGHRAVPAPADRRADFADAGIETSIRYIDPSYAIRSVPANPYDSVYCVRLAQAAVHAAMSGRTEMVVGRYRRRFVHIPMAAAVSRRNMVDPQGDLWLAVLQSTGQPVVFGLTAARPGSGARRGLAMRFLGHSTVRLELAGTVLLTDPVLTAPDRAAAAGRARSRPGRLGRRRPGAAVPPARDHLHLPSLRRLSAVGARVVVPRGAGGWLRARGVARVDELAPGETLAHDELRSPVCRRRTAATAGVPAPPVARRPAAWGI